MLQDQHERVHRQQRRRKIIEFKDKYIAVAAAELGKPARAHRQ
jgi:hypothetical protein